MKLRFAITMLVSSFFLSSCSTVNKTFDSIGGFFNKKGDKCTGPDCDTPSLIDNQQTAKKWHCYGKQGSESWACQDTPDPSKISAIQPASSQPTSSTMSPIPAPGYAGSGVSVTGASAATPTIKIMDTAVAQTKATSIPVDPAASRIPNLLDQPEDYYTIQLVALPEKSEILEYAGNHGISSPITARINSQGLAWYVLLLGVYPDLSAAEKAKSDWVGERTLKVQPWVRKLGPLQIAIREAEDKPGN